MNGEIQLSFEGLLFRHQPWHRYLILHCREAPVCAYTYMLESMQMELALHHRQLSIHVFTLLSHVLCNTRAAS
jgi:hypothetical protein